MQIRDARPEDAAAVCEVLRRSIAELCVADHRDDPGLLAAWLRNKTPDRVAVWIARADASFLVAVDGGAIAAVGAVADSGEILLNYVSPPARFRAASTAMLAALERRAVERGATRISLISTETARRFYRARGYAELGEPVRKYGMESGYPMFKAFGPSSPLPPGDAGV
jgi:GNAT superfamily N-acetyltransferase